MRHGRKSKTERIDGYKEYVARDLDNDLTIAAGVLPANLLERHGADKLRPQIAAFGEVKSVFVDCAFLSGELFDEVRSRPGGEVICRALRPARLGFYVKTDFAIDLAAGVVRCPAHKLAVIRSDHVRFATADCSACGSRAKCQPATAKEGRTIHIHPEEALQQAFRAAQKTPEGRARLRKRVPVEHTLAHQRGAHGRGARYRGVAKNDFDAQRIAAMNNLQAIDCRLRKSAEPLWMGRPRAYAEDTLRQAAALLDAEGVLRRAQFGAGRGCAGRGRRRGDRPHGRVRPAVLHQESRARGAHRTAGQSPAGLRLLRSHDGALPGGRRSSPTSSWHKPAPERCGGRVVRRRGAPQVVAVSDDRAPGCRTVAVPRANAVQRNTRAPDRGAPRSARRRRRCG